MPYLGVHYLESEDPDDFGPGLRLGGMIGFFVTPQFSLNAELALDFINYDNIPQGMTAFGLDADFALSPLVHVDAGSLELVFGPKLGAWAGTSIADGGGQESQASASGMVLGVNAGAFGRISNHLGAGVLVSFVWRHASEICARANGGPEQCFAMSDVENVNATRTLSLSGALAF